MKTQISDNQRLMKFLKHLSNKTLLGKEGEDKELGKSICENNIVEFRECQIKTETKALKYGIYQLQKKDI